MSEYFQKLRDPRWQRKRLEVMQRDGFACKYCRDSESTLNVHHILYVKKVEPWDYPDEFIVTLCEKCHSETHDVQQLGKLLMDVFMETGGDKHCLRSLLLAVGKFRDAGFKIDWHKASKEFPGILSEAK